MNIIWKKIKRYLVLYLVMLLVMVLALWGACALRGGIRENVLASARLIQQEGLYPEYFGFKLFQMDNYTDTLMLWEAVSVEEAPTALQGAMSTPIYEMEDFEGLAFKLEKYLTGDSSDLAGRFDYNRYWHGYLIWLRPLLMVFTLSQIRLINAAVLFGLLAVLIWRIYKKLGMCPAVCFLCSQLAVTVWWVPRQNQYFWAFAVAYVGCLLTLGKCGDSEEDFLPLLFGLGGAVVFFELLVTPLVTLGLPVCLYLARHPEEKPFLRLLSVVKGSVLWSIGYGGFWLSRWVISGVVTGSSVIGNAVSQMGVRTGGGKATWKGMELTMGNILGFLLKNLTEKHLLLPLCGAMLAGLAVYLLLCKGGKAVAENGCYLLCAAMTPVWFFVLREHSIQHFWFTWRAFSVTALGMLLFLTQTCSLRAACNKLHIRRKNQ